MVLLPTRRDRLDQESILAIPQVTNRPGELFAMGAESSLSRRTAPPATRLGRCSEEFRSASELATHEKITASYVARILTLTPARARHHAGDSRRPAAHRAQADHPPPRHAPRLAVSAAGIPGTRVDVEITPFLGDPGRERQHGGFTNGVRPHIGGSGDTVPVRPLQASPEHITRSYSIVYPLVHCPT